VISVKKGTEPQDFYLGRIALLDDRLTRLVSGYLEAYAARDSDACARCFTPEGALFSPFGPPAEGRAAIAATHGEWFASKEEDKRLEVLECHMEGALGHCVLHWSGRVPDEESGHRLESGYSLCVLKATEGGLLFHRLALVPDTD
jgi:ketosteroid isomerase-like protein